MYDHTVYCGSSSGSLVVITSSLSNVIISSSGEVYSLFIIFFLSVYSAYSLAA